MCFACHSSAFELPVIALYKDGNVLPQSVPLVGTCCGNELPGIMGILLAEIALTYSCAIGIKYFVFVLLCELLRVKALAGHCVTPVTGLSKRTSRIQEHKSDLFVITVLFSKLHYVHTHVGLCWWYDKHLVGIQQNWF